MIEISLVISETQMDELESLFCEELQQNWLLYQENPRKPVYLKGYFENEEQAREQLRVLESEVGPLDTRTLDIRPFEDQDWKLAYRHHLHPWQYGRLRWIPEWERDRLKPQDNEACLYLDSGMAFGTGSHETTRLCAEAMVDFLESEGANVRTVIDAGCGSGILAMSAARLGVESVCAFDRDPEAVRVTRNNLEKNGLQSRVEVLEAGLEEGLRNRLADMILANIQADVLMIYADELIRAWNPDGQLILSGILWQEREKVEECFSSTLEKHHDSRSFSHRIERKGDWISLVYVSGSTGND